MVTLTRAEIEDAFMDLGARARAEDKVIDIAVYGGSALTLASNFRLGTGDVDAVAEFEQQTVDRLGKAIAAERGWPSDWINDGVRVFLSPNVDGTAEHHQLFRSYPDEANPGVRVFVPSPEYLLAMKLVSLRVEDTGIRTAKDAPDIKHLLTICKIDTPRAAIEFLAEFYPEYGKSNVRLHARKFVEIQDFMAKGIAVEITPNYPAPAPPLEIATKPLVPSRTVPPLAEVEIAAKASASAAVNAQEEATKQLALAVYGNSNALQRSLAEVARELDQATAVGETIATAVRSAPETIAPLAGSGGSLMSGADATRQAALAAVRPLSEAIETYGHALADSRRAILQEHDSTQRIEAIEVPAPSRPLAATLALPVDKRIEVLTTNTAQRDELTKIHLALGNRLTPADNRAIQSGDTAALAKSLKIAPEAAQQVAQVRSQIATTYDLVRTQLQKLAQAQGIAPTIKK